MSNHWNRRLDPLLRQRFNRFLKTTDTRKSYSSDRSGCRRIGVRILEQTVSELVEERMHSISSVQEPKREVRSRGTDHRTLTNKLYRCFTYKKIYRFVKLQQFLKAYNNTVHTAHSMAPIAVTDKHVLEIWTPMNGRRTRVHVENLNSIWHTMLESVRKKLNSQSGRNKIIRTRYLES